MLKFKTFKFDLKYFWNYYIVDFFFNLTPTITYLEQDGKGLCIIMGHFTIYLFAGGYKIMKHTVGILPRQFLRFYYLVLIWTQQWTILKRVLLCWLFLRLLSRHYRSLYFWLVQCSVLSKHDWAWALPSLSDVITLKLVS